MGEKELHNCGNELDRGPGDVQPASPDPGGERAEEKTGNAVLMIPIYELSMNCSCVKAIPPGPVRLEWIDSSLRANARTKIVAEVLAKEMGPTEEGIAQRSFFGRLQGRLYFPRSCDYYLCV